MKLIGFIILGFPLTCFLAGFLQVWHEGQGGKKSSSCGIWMILYSLWVAAVLIFMS